jgi:ABC-type branched-subunit amino acid transport system ATPase component
MSETNVSTDVRRPILMVVVGRQRVGKTTVVNTIIQKVRDGGGDLKIWNADVNMTCPPRRGRFGIWVESDHKGPAGQETLVGQILDISLRAEWCLRIRMLASATGLGVRKRVRH